MKILYYTSTGNNLFIAKQLGGELLSIPQLVKDNIYEIKDDSVGIVFPVFFATSPKTLREFVEKVNIHADYIFLICSYGSDGDYHALKIMKKTFNKRGININYTNSVLMVDNFLPVFDMAHEMEIKNDSDIEKQIEIIKNDIISKKDFIYSKKHFTNVPFIEKILESTMTSKYHIIADDGCSSCRICTKVCPRGNIEVIDGKPHFGEACDFCLSCVHHCKTHTLSINDEANPNERYINPNVKLSEIIKSNNLYQ
ncbi:MAG: EFR1 family ferrodoxin [Methanobrevibacter sp.]|uniref:EFR1 family ferrodoxin n=1 Tax=Methanobrevibacter sp. TaxID=66852 RepID=UPI0025F06CD8|nr:EFR1 family ferrodoxin [Methanobrevibacter sp.]MBR0271539.1 EFR1 family ferrodoxin [Methanobrevibacter sp.]